MYKVILFYKYLNIAEPEKEAAWHRVVAQKLRLKGRMIIASEGVNGTFEGDEKDIEEYVKWIKDQPQYEDVHIKYSDGDGKAFPKLSIKVRDEIVSGHLGDGDVNPAVATGKYLSAEELHDWFHEGKEFYMVDMRNDYEHKVGFFKNAVLPPLKNFRDLPKILPELEHLRDKTVVTYCTGGVRCEKASGYLVTQGFKDVYQLYGGIHTYMEKYPNQDFLGKLYVFDGRITMGFNTDSAEHQIVGKCDKCGKMCDRYVNCAYPRCNKHFICCDNCLDRSGKAYCSTKCKMYNRFYPVYLAVKQLRRRLITH